MEFVLLYNESDSEIAKADDPAQAPAYWGAWNAYIGALQGSGVMRSGNGLAPPRTALRLSIRNGKRSIEDGPYADTKEHLGGYVVVEVDTIDEALEWAARSPAATAGSVEVRPVLPPPPAE